MTEQELEQIMRKVLIDVQKTGENQVCCEDLSFDPSIHYQRNMRAMRKDPMKWMKNRERPVWKRVMRQVAMVLLVISVGFAGLMVAVPTARAAVIRWVTEWYETHIVYRYIGDNVTPASNEYKITELPDGFSEVERIDLSNIVWVAYADGEGNVISFDYSYMHQGASSAVTTEDAIVTDITVKNMVGHFFEAKESGEFNTITWIDERNNIQFTISGQFDKEALLHMAMSVS